MSSGELESGYWSRLICMLPGARVCVCARARAPAPSLAPGGVEAGAWGGAGERGGPCP